MIQDPSSRTRKMTSPIMASLLRTNRDMTMVNWPRTFASGGSTTPNSMSWASGIAVGACRPGSMSGKSDPRVEHGVEDVGDDVEAESGGRRHDQPGLHRADVGGDRAGEALQEKLAHAVPAEG